MLTGLSHLTPENFLSSYDNFEFAIRILLAAALGCIIGLERARRLKGAGIRTQCIIAMSAAVFMILSKYAFMDTEGLSGIKGTDPARITAQVVSGISFLGAGIIFKQGRNTVRGLTTAAGMWATSAVGMCIGAGMYWVGLTLTLALLILQFTLHKFQIGTDALTEQQLQIRMKNDKDLRRLFLELLESHQCLIDETEITRDKDMIRIVVNVRSSYPITFEQAMRFLHDNPDVRDFHIEDM